MKLIEELKNINRQFGKGISVNEATEQQLELFKKWALEIVTLEDYFNYDPFYHDGIIEEARKRIEESTVLWNN